MNVFATTRTTLIAAAFAAAATATTAPAAGPTVERDPLFDLVASKLDSGGTSYQYADIRGGFAAALKALDNFIELSGSKDGAMVPPVARAVIEATGLDAVTAFGSSVARLSDGNRRMISFVAAKKRAGLMALFGGGRRTADLEGLAIVPEDAIMATVVTVDLGRLVGLAEEAARGIAGSVGTGAVRNGLKEFKKESGVDAEKILAGLGDEVGVFVRLDPERTATIPVDGNSASDGDDEVTRDSTDTDADSGSKSISKSKTKGKKGPKTLTVPVPQIVVWIKTKDDALADAITEALKKGKAKTADAELPTGLKGLAVETPKNDFSMAPVVAKGFDRVFIATSAEALTVAAAARDAGKTLATNADYKRLAPAGPDHADGVTFLSPRWAEQTSKLWDQAEKIVTKKDDRNSVALAKTISEFTSAPGGLLVRRYNDPEGLLWVTVAGGAGK